MTGRMVALVAAGWTMGCDGTAPKSEAELDIYDLAPTGTPNSADSDASSPPPIAWEGPEVEPVTDQAWGGLGIELMDRDCLIWWSLVGGEDSCSDCALAFSMEATSLGDTCGGLGASSLRLELLVIDGHVYGYGQDWGEAEYGGGLLTWNGEGFGSMYTYRYYGYVHY